MQEAHLLPLEGFEEDGSDHDQDQGHHQDDLGVEGEALPPSFLDDVEDGDKAKAAHDDQDHRDDVEPDVILEMDEGAFFVDE